MSNKKKTKTNLINGLIAGLMLFSCTCTLCNKKTNFGFIIPKMKSLMHKISPVSETDKARISFGDNRAEFVNEVQNLVVEK